jgi:hypothetical protein
MAPTDVTVGRYLCSIEGAINDGFSRPDPLAHKEMNFSHSPEWTRKLAAYTKGPLTRPKVQPQAAKSKPVRDT